MDTFIKDHKFLEEVVSDEDHLDFSGQIKTFSEKINALKKSGLIGLVADFGKGKSTLIHQVHLSRESEDEKWIDFEAWNMPDRKDLWEGFVLEMAKQIDKKTFDEARKSIDGTKGADKKTLINTIGDIPGLAVIKNLNHFLDTSPARRVFEIQEILIDLIDNKCKESLIVVVAEDIDRSGPNGIYFIETVKSFLKNTPLNKKIVVITPISEKSFFDNQESYLKCLDIVDFLDLSQVKLDKFFNAILNDTIPTNQKSLVTQYFEYLLKNFPDTTLRKVKLILRKAEISYLLQKEAGLEPDWRMSVLFESLKFFRDEKGVSYFDEYNRRGAVLRSSIFGAYLQVVYSQSKNGNYTLLDRDGKIVHPKVDFRFTHRRDETDAVRRWPSIPWFGDHPINDEQTFYIVDFYLKY